MQNLDVPVDEDICLIFYCLSVVVKLEVPFAGLVIPNSRRNAVVELDELASLEYLGAFAKVLENFCAWCIVLD